MMTDPSVVRAGCVGPPVGPLPPAGMVFVDPSVVRTGRIGSLVGPLPPAGMMFVDPGTPWLLWKSCRAPVWSLQTSKKSGFPAQQTSRRRPRLHAEFIPEGGKHVLRHPVGLFLAESVCNCAASVLIKKRVGRLRLGRVERDGRRPVGLFLAKRVCNCAASTLLKKRVGRLRLGRVERDGRRRPVGLFLAERVCNCAASALLENALNVTDGGIRSAFFDDDDDGSELENQTKIDEILDLKYLDAVQTSTWGQ